LAAAAVEGLRRSSVGAVAAVVAQMLTAEGAVGRGAARPHSALEVLVERRKAAEAEEEADQSQRIRLVWARQLGEAVEAAAYRSDPNLGAAEEEEAHQLVWAARV
jgi:hypothetical protein